ncbi:hypothetical protein H4582DRAFT_2059324 [Lactarius indigo]|nr:hypothetical protein H4582DRAFT_2059324 [Lactarius indigo]
MSANTGVNATLGKGGGTQKVGHDRHRNHLAPSWFARPATNPPPRVENPQRGSMRVCHDIRGDAAKMRMRYGAPCIRIRRQSDFVFGQANSSPQPTLLGISYGPRLVTRDFTSHHPVGDGGYFAGALAGADCRGACHGQASVTVQFEDFPRTKGLRGRGTLFPGDSRRHIKPSSVPCGKNEKKLEGCGRQERTGRGATNTSTANNQTTRQGCSRKGGVWIEWTTQNRPVAP